MSIKVGEVIAVHGVKVTLKIFEDSSKDTLYYDGDKYKGVSIREYISIQRGFRNIICIIEGEYLDENKVEEDDSKTYYIRKVEAKPIGYFEQENFYEGIKFLPMIKDVAFLLKESKISEIYSRGQSNGFVIGKMLKEDIPISLPWQKLFNTHIGIFGNTGSGKSNTLAKLYTVLFEQKLAAIENKSKFVILDFNGEYTANQLVGADHKTTLQLNTQTDGQDKFPLNENEFWNSETLSILFQATANTQRPFLNRVINGRNKFSHIPDSLLVYIKKTFEAVFTAAAPKADTLDLLRSIVRILDIAELSDMLKEITGTPISENFAKEITGKHALTISCDITPSDVYNKCIEVYDAYINGGYETHFKWIDNIRAVEDKDLIDLLDNKLFIDLYDCVINGNAIDLHLSPPDIIDYSSFGAIGYKGFRSKKEFDIMDIDDYISELKRLSVDFENINEIKNHRVAEKQDSHFIDKWKVYECFVYETVHLTNKYVLSDGQWYAIDRSLVDEVENYLNRLTLHSFLPDAKQNDNEETYNQDLESSHATSLICFDRKLISLDGWSSSIEACDFFSKDLQFIHIKDEASSSKLSHLFNQGLVSAEAYLREKDFRKEFKKKARNMNRSIAKMIPDIRIKPERDDFEIIYAVMRKPYKDGSYGLPFFSKVTLRNASKRLEDLGYKVGFSWIKKIL